MKYIATAIRYLLNLSPSFLTTPIPTPTPAKQNYDFKFHNLAINQTCTEAKLRSQFD